MAKKKKYWKIQGWDSFTLLFEHRISVSHISENRLRELIKVLTSKISLSEKEIISSYANKGTKSYLNHLEITHSSVNKYMYSCGENPYVTAEIEHESLESCKTDSR
ncbi:MAG: hypothetical protein PHE96_06060 [Methylococcales bacterium]|nr:hypothetical protein [Methylococcales bacterium]